MEYRSIPTTLGRAKLEQAALLGVPLQLTVVEFGDGGGAEYEPTGLESALRGKVYEAAPNMLFNSAEAETWVELHAVIPFDVGGWWLREYGVRDSAGDLIFIGNLPSSFKPIGSSGAVKDIAFELLFDIQNADSVTLKIDPSKVLATRKFVEDWVAQELAKLDHKQSVRYATKANIVLSGLGVQAGGDWAVALTAGDRVVVKNQNAAKDNGIYIVAAGAWVRATDADQSTEVTPGLVVGVEQGATLADTRWQLVTDGAIVLGTTALTFQDVTFGYTPLSRIQTSASDTTAGALLAVGAFGLGSWGVTAISADLNNEIRSGWVGATVGDTQNKPVTLDGVCLVSGWTPSSGGRCTQMFFPNITDTRIYTRSLGGGGWTAWVEVWHGGNLVKQASPTDDTAGAMMSVGAFGLGSVVAPKAADINNQNLPAGFYMTDDGGATVGTFPAGASEEGVLIVGQRASGNCSQLYFTRDNRMFFRTYSTTLPGWNAWREQWHSGNLIKQASKTDATLGSMLAVGAFGLGDPAPAGAVFDANALIITGTYSCAGTSTNLPTANPHVVQVMAYSPTAVVQMATRQAADGLYIRRLNAGTWSPWAAVAYLDSPALTGSPTAPTQAPGDSSQKVATTAFATAAALAAGVGAGQSWQNVLGSRAAGVIYTNSAGRPIMVMTTVSGTPYQAHQIYVNGLNIGYSNSGGINYSQSGCVTFIVPAGGTYQLSVGVGSVTYWTELR